MTSFEALLADNPAFAERYDRMTAWERQAARYKWIFYCDRRDNGGADDKAKAPRRQAKPNDGCAKESLL